MDDDANRNKENGQNPMEDDFPEQESQDFPMACPILEMMGNGLMRVKPLYQSE